MKLTDDENEMISAINKYREDRNLPPMAVSLFLMELARIRCGEFSHQAHGMWVWEHANRLGFDGFCTDNIANGYESGAAAVGDATSGWGDEREGHTVGHDMQMKGFRKLNGEWIDMKFDMLGVAQEGLKYIAIFGRNDK